MTRRTAIFDRQFWLVLIYLLVVTGLVFAVFAHYGYDDPYITYRHARNLRDGLGFVYNPAEQVQATTTPLLTLLLAGLGFFWPNLPALAVFIGAASLALGGLFLWDMAHTWGMPVAGWAALLLYPTFNFLYFTLGSETPLYLALCLGAMAFYLRGRYPFAAALAALAALARPDGLLVAVILAADYLLVVRRRIPWRAVLVYLGILLPWVIFAWVYFGSPLPVTLAAKQNQGALAVSERFAGGLFTTIQTYTNQWSHGLELALAAAGLLAWFKAPRRWGILLAWTAAYFAAYTLLGVSRYFWYYAPLVPGFVVLAACGLQLLADLLMPRARLSRAAVLALLLPLVFFQLYVTWGLRTFNDSRMAIYTTIGRWLFVATPPEASVAALEVGITGYFAERRMVDFAGLLQPDVATRLEPGGTYDAAVKYAIRQYRPDYVILKQGDYPSIQQMLLNRNCLLARTFDGQSYGFAGNFDIYACR